MRGYTAFELIEANPLAFVLTYTIAARANWHQEINAQGLKRGEAFLGDFKSYGMTERQYRTAKSLLAKSGLATFKTTNKGTIAKLCDTRIWQLFPGSSDGQNANQATGKRQASDGQATTNGLTKELNEPNNASFPDPGVNVWGE